MSVFSKKSNKLHKGFTIIEIMVAVTIFVGVMIMAGGSIAAVFDANQKSKTLRSVMDNLNLTLESMTRNIRFGTKYHCGSSGDITQPADCGGAGSSTFTVLSMNGTRVTYSLSSGRIIRSIGGIDSYITSGDVTVTKLTFRVYGSPPYVNGAGSCPGSNDCFQPQVIIVVSGYVGVKAASKSTFTLETTISQRIFDFQ